MGRAAWAVLSLWALGSIAFGASGLLAELPRPVIPMLIATPVIASWQLYRRSEAVRAWARSLGLAGPISFHLVRLGFGAAFLVLGAEGRLPSSFAVPAGWGDIVAGGLAPLAAWLASSSEPRARRLVLAWNALALADIVMVVVNAQRLILLVGDARMLAAFRELPFALLPSFVVPLVIITHLLVFARLSARSRA